MNSFNGIGRLTKDPEIRAMQNGESIAKYTIAIDRPTKTSDGQSADFLPCVCFGKVADFAQRYLRKGTKIGISGRIQTGSYTNKDGVKVYTTDVIVSSHTFCEKVGAEKTEAGMPEPSQTGFVSVDDAELPWN